VNNADDEDHWAGLRRDKLVQGGHQPRSSPELNTTHAGTKPGQRNGTMTGDTGITVIGNLTSGPG
jgi:hypothetical protein